MSPVGAHGGSCAIESVAAFANSLVCHLRICSGNTLSRKVVQSIFATYQDSRETRVRKIARSVEAMTRLNTWDSLTKKLMALYLLPWLSDVGLVKELVKDAVRVQFIPVPARSKGFVDQLSQRDIAAKKREQRLRRRFAKYASIGSAICAIVLLAKRWGRR